MKDGRKLFGRIWRWMNSSMIKPNFKRNSLNINCWKTCKRIRCSKCEKRARNRACKETWHKTSKTEAVRGIQLKEYCYYCLDAMMLAEPTVSLCLMCSQWVQVIQNHSAKTGDHLSTLREHFAVAFTARKQLEDNGFLWTMTLKLLNLNSHRDKSDTACTQSSITGWDGNSKEQILKPDWVKKSLPNSYSHKKKRQKCLWKREQKFQRS